MKIIRYRIIRYRIIRSTELFSRSPPNLGTSEIIFVKKNLNFEKVINIKKNFCDLLYNLVKVFGDRKRISERPLFCVWTLYIVGSSVSETPPRYGVIFFLWGFFEVGNTMHPASAG